MRFEMAAAAKGAATQSRPAVSRTKADVGSATRNEESYASAWVASAMPPWPHCSSSPVITSTASAAVRARSSPRRTRSIPISAGAAADESWVVATRSFPMATPCSLTPCSAPHSHVGQDSKAAWAPVSPMVRYWVRNEHPADDRRPKGHVIWGSPGGRSEFLANTMPEDPRAQRVSHMVAVYGGG